jgi:hypothetical protein
MDRPTALSQLATLTAGLKPSSTTTAADLTTARAALASSLLAHAVDPTMATTGLPTPPAGAPSSEDLISLSHALHTAAAAEATTPVPLVFARKLPALAVGNPGLIPVSVAGMLPRSIGPDHPIVEAHGKETAIEVLMFQHQVFVCVFYKGNVIAALDRQLTPIDLDLAEKIFADISPFENAEWWRCQHWELLNPDPETTCGEYLVAKLAEAERISTSLYI